MIDLLLKNRFESITFDSIDLAGTRFDEGFFDCIEGTCPKGHRQTLMD